MPIAGQALGGQRLEMVPIIPKCKSDKSTRDYRATWSALLGRQSRVIWNHRVSMRDRPGERGEQEGFPEKWYLSDSEGSAGVQGEKGDSRQKQDNSDALMATGEASSVGTEGVVNRSSTHPALNRVSLNKWGSGQLWVGLFFPAHAVSNLIRKASPSGKAPFHLRKGHWLGEHRGMCQTLFWYMDCWEGGNRPMSSSA